MQAAPLPSPSRLPAAGVSRGVPSRPTSRPAARPQSPATESRMENARSGAVSTSLPKSLISARWRPMNAGSRSVAHPPRRLRPMATAKKRGTTPSNFGVGKRESHDATAFYDRFTAPELSDDDTVVEPYAIPDPFVLGDARHMD